MGLDLDDVRAVFDEHAAAFYTNAAVAEIEYTQAGERPRRNDRGDCGPGGARRRHRQVGVLLAERGWTTAVADPLAIELEEPGRHLRDHAGRDLGLDERSARTEMLVLQDARRLEARGRDDTTSLGLGGGGLHRLVREECLEHGVQHIHVLHADERLLPHRVGELLGRAHPLPHGTPLAGREQHEPDRTVLAPDHRVDRGIARAHDRLGHTCGHDGRRVCHAPGVELRDGLESREVDVLPATGRPALVQRGEYREDGVHGGRVGREASRGQQGRLRGDPRDREPPRHRDHHVIGRGVSRVGPGLAERCDRAHDQVRERGAQRVGREPESLERAGGR